MFPLRRINWMCGVDCNKQLILDDFLTPTRICLNLTRFESIWLVFNLIVEIRSHHMKNGLPHSISIQMKCEHGEDKQQQRNKQRWKNKSAWESVQMSFDYNKFAAISFHPAKKNMFFVDLRCDASTKTSYNTSERERERETAHTQWMSIFCLNRPKIIQIFFPFSSLAFIPGARIMTACP